MLAYVIRVKVEILSIITPPANWHRTGQNW